MRLRQAIPLVVVLAGLALYLVLFYATGLPNVEDIPGHAMRRGKALGICLLQLDELLVLQWFGTPLGFHLVERLPVLAVAGGILGFATALGWLLMALVRADRGLTRVERLVFATAVGLNAISTYVLLVGLAGWLNNILVITLPAAVVLVMTAGLGWRRVRWNVAQPPPAVRPPSAVPDLSHSRGRLCHKERAGTSPKPEEQASLDSRWLWLAIPFVVAILLGGMLPPVEFDVREYHLQVPKEFYQQGRITFLPHNVYGNMAMGTEMLSLLAMTLVRDWWLGALVGKTITATFAPLTALGLWAAGRRLASPTVGLVAAVVYISIPWITQVSTLGLIEGAAACYLFLAVYAVLLYGRPAEPSAPRTSNTSRLLLAGYLTGGAVSAKYPAALFVAVPLTLWLVWLHVGSRWSAPWKSMAAFVLALVVGCGLWFGKNWAMADNPTYPLLYEVFGGKTWTPEKDARWNRAHRPHDFSLSTLGKDVARVGLTSPWLSPLLVPLAVLGLAHRRHQRLAWGLAGYFAYVIAVWWLFTHRIDRFWIPAMPVLALLAGLGAGWVFAGGWRRSLATALVLGCVANFVMIASPLAGDNRFFVSLERLRNDPNRVDAWQRYYNTHGTGGRLLLVGEAQVFDLQPPLVYNTCFDSSIFEQLVRDHSPEEIRQALAEQNITDVYVHWGEIERYRRTYGFTDFVQPEVFQRLVGGGVLEPLPPIQEQPSGRGYRVLPAELRRDATTR